MLPEKTADDVFELASVDITALPLTTDEGFIVSRLVGRRVGAADLARETGFSLLQVNSLLESLVKKGALSFSAVQKAPPPQLQELLLQLPLRQLLHLRHPHDMICRQAALLLAFSRV